MAAARNARRKPKAVPGRAARRPAKRAAKRAPAPRRAAPKRATRPAGKPAASKRRGAPPARAGVAPNGLPVGSGIGLLHHHMDYSTQDLEGVKRFFTEVLGFTNFIHMPEHRYLTVFVTPRSSLGFMVPADGPPEQWRPPGEPGFYFFVEDVDRAYEALLARGVAFEQPPRDMPWGHRLAILRDPEGRMVCLARDRKR